MERHFNSFNRSIHINESYLKSFDLDASTGDIIQSQNTIGDMEELGKFTNIESCYSWSASC